MSKSLTFTTATLAALVSISSIAPSEAAIVTSSDRSTFNSQGSIIHNSNFDDFGTNFSFPGADFTRGDVTYTTSDNLIVGTGTYVAPQQNVIAYNRFSPLTGNIATSPNKYTLFGFDLGMFGDPTATIELITNKGNFSLGPIQAPSLSNLGFFGFRTTEIDEYFTGFRISSSGSLSAPGITNVALGISNPTAVPTPALLPGLIGMGIAALRKRKGGRAEVVAAQE